MKLVSGCTVYTFSPNASQINILYETLFLFWWTVVISSVHVPLVFTLPDRYRSFVRLYAQMHFFIHVLPFIRSCSYILSIPILVSIWQWLQRNFPMVFLLLGLLFMQFIQFPTFSEILSLSTDTITVLLLVVKRNFLARIILDSTTTYARNDFPTKQPRIP